MTTAEVDSPILHADPPVGAKAARLRQVFNQILREAAEKLEAINIALGTDGEGDYGKYREARRNYIEFLERINNQDPLESPFGAAFNWVVIEPILLENGLIDGAIVRAKWLGGTHSSSSGVPIVH